MNDDSCRPESPAADWLSQGYARLALEQWQEAGCCFEAALAADTATVAERVEALDALARLLIDQHRAGEAVPLLARADQLEPDQPHRLAVRAAAEAAAGLAAAAVATCRRWLSLRPDSAAAHAALAGQLLGQGEREAALAPLREAVLLDPGDAEAAAGLAGLYCELDQPLAALEAVQPTLRRVADHPALLYQIGRAWLALGETAKAVAAWQRSVQSAPSDSALAAAALARVTAEPGAASAPPAAVYVRALFDRYAERFDDALIGQLDYRVPGLLRQALGRLPSSAPVEPGEAAGVAAGGAPGRGLDVLDLGCGTGLAGEALRPLARHLAGVDLSPRMIEVAQRRGIYHHLSTGDLLAALAEQAGRWDLLVAADVFNYLGDLGPVLLAAAHALRPGGRLAATVEQAAEPDAVTVTAQRRVSHGVDHVRNAAAVAGLSVLTLEPAVLRLEARLPVAGLLFVLEKPWR